MKIKIKRVSEMGDGRSEMGGPPSREAWPPQTRPRPSELLPPGEAGYPLTQEDSEGLRREVEGGKVVNSEFGMRISEMGDGWRVTGDGLRATGNSQPATGMDNRRGAEMMRGWLPGRAGRWSPYTSPDLCGIPSGDWNLGACAPAQWSLYTSPDLCSDLSEKWVWVLTHPRND